MYLAFLLKKKTGLRLIFQNYFKSWTTFTDFWWPYSPILWCWGGSRSINTETVHQGPTYFLPVCYPFGYSDGELHWKFLPCMPSYLSRHLNGILTTRTFALTGRAETTKINLWTCHHQMVAICIFAFAQHLAENLQSIPSSTIKFDRSRRSSWCFLLITARYRLRVSRASAGRHSLAPLNINAQLVRTLDYATMPIESWVGV